MKLISIVVPLFNEEENFLELNRRISASINGFEGKYTFEIIYIDNASDDNTVTLLREAATLDPRIKGIVNSRNFGANRSWSHGIKQAFGDAVISIAGDLQDPPELIPQYLFEWEKGSKIVLAVKSSSSENFFMKTVRRLYYRTLSAISEAPLINDATGAGLYDKQVVEVFRNLEDPYPYFRGLLAETGFGISKVSFSQPLRGGGKSKNNFLNLYDFGMLGLITHSRIPVRILSIFGFFVGALSVIVGISYLIAKIFFWREFDFGVAPLLFGVFFLGGIQIAFIGFIGEYLMSMHARLRRVPLVFESERINF